MSRTTQSANNFNALIDESYSKVYNMAYRLSGNRQDAEDLTQEACYRAFRSFEDFEGDRPFVNWIFRIVTRLYLDLRRNRSRRVSEVSLEVPLNNGSERELRFEPVDTRPSPEKLLLNDVLSEELEDALSELSRDQLELVRMADLSDMDYSDIAMKLETSGGTVRSRLHRAHQQMRKQLAGTPRKNKVVRTTRLAKPSITPVRRSESSAPSSSWMTTSFVNLVKASG